ncbi:hypothetical protein SAMN04488513_107177 [Pseudozobellia thermophila]|uniref:Uncharacterized protein n=1 Tax=Pseudozobellia thermophila TaxID=192903 RepID=A0A1M6LIU4_9FLAO|nr:hypothetical protein SAMN04488513_107177 [Pseudozobellia thermophila]
MFALGNGISFGGSLMESAATANWVQGGTSTGAFAIDLGTDALIQRIPGSQLATKILLQNKSLKIKLIEQAIINNQ